MHGIPNQYLVSEIFGDLPAIPAGGGTTEPVPTAHYDGQYLYESGIKEYDTEPATFHQARPHTDQDLEIYRIVVDTWNKNGVRVSYGVIYRFASESPDTSKYYIFPGPI